MSRNRSLFGLLALAGALLAMSSIPAAAEFFSCNQRPGQVLYSYTGTPDQYIRRQRRYSARRYQSRASRTYTTRSQRRRATYSNDPRYWNGR
jgi:hypothetical protein